jgi:hypothetical protein
MRSFARKRIEILTLRTDWTENEKTPLPARRLPDWSIFPFHRAINCGWQARTPAAAATLPPWKARTRHFLTSPFSATSAPCAGSRAASKRCGRAVRRSAWAVDRSAFQACNPGTGARASQVRLTTAQLWHKTCSHPPGDLAACHFGRLLLRCG